jgi:EF-P beta-lysylation protein EpmB
MPVPVEALNSQESQHFASDAPEKWQQSLADLITEPKELLALLELDPADAAMDEAAAHFPLRVPREFAARMAKGDWRDPLLLQVWPSILEGQQAAGFSQDPLEETRFTVAPGLIQKYRGRALLTAAPHCAVHCRYCFRRHFDYTANSPSRSEWLKTLDVLRASPEIGEVILSGGDPLALNDRQLGWLLAQLEDIPQLHTLRIHSRTPVVIPSRLTPSLTGLLRQSRLQCVLVLHSNHANELGSELVRPLQDLQANGVTLLNQSVLLRDVNDSAATLIELSRRLFALHVLPYYLHLPDRVTGTAHFDVSEQRGRELIAEIETHLPGYLVPRLVREEPGAGSKTRQ